MRFPGRTRMLPGCGSPWKSPSSKSCRNAASMTFRATCSRSKPARGGDLGDLHPLDVVEREHGGAGELVVDPGDDEEVAARARRRAIAMAFRASLREVELLVHGPVELLDDAGRRVDAGLLDHRLEELSRGSRGGRGRTRSARGCCGRCTFTTTRSPAWVRRAVDLGDGRARERPRRRARRRAPPPAGRGRARSRARISASGSGGQSSCSDSSSSTQCGREEVGRRGEELAELREGGPELGEQLRGSAPRCRGPGGGSGSPRAGARRRGRSTSRSRVRARYAPKPCRAIAAAIWRRRFRSWKARSNIGRATVAPGSRGRQRRRPRTAAERGVVEPIAHAGDRPGRDAR